jgi:hypothetical protein
MQHWLDAVRPLVPDLIRATGLSYGRAKPRELDTQSSPNVFQRHRRLARALEILVIDERRRDAAQVLPLLQAQLKLAERTAEVGGLIALLVANSQSTVSHETISAMVMQGEIDRDMAIALVADTESIADVEKLGLWRFVEADFEELERRLATLRAADASQRAAVARSLGLFNGDDDAYAGLKHRPLSDDALLYASAQEGYKAGTRASTSPARSSRPKTTAIGATLPTRPTARQSRCPSRSRSSRVTPWASRSR